MIMPEKYQREMLADWYSAGRAYGNPNTAEWYLEKEDSNIRRLLCCDIAYEYAINNKSMAIKTDKDKIVLSFVESPK